MCVCLHLCVSVCGVKGVRVSASLCMCLCMCYMYFMSTCDDIIYCKLRHRSNIIVVVLELRCC